MHNPVRVLFLCEGNADRSQMAEGLLRKLGGADYEVHSAGLEPKDIHPMAIEVMREIGIDISGHAVSHLEDYVDTQFDFVITLSDQGKSNWFAFQRDGQALHWPCDDPSVVTGTDELKLAAYRHAREAINEALTAWIAENRK